MKLTKYVHACLLVDTDDDVTIFDPGEFSYASKLLDINSLPRLDRIVISHAHFDHFSEEFVAELVAKFPNVRIITTPEVVAKLQAKGINAQTTGDDMIELFEAPHESMAPLAELPMLHNTGAHYKGILTHPGDCLQVAASKDIFAMPLAGPWGAAIEGVRLAAALKPKTIVPIHDWMWNETWKSDMYDRLEAYFNSVNIKFLKMVDGQPVEL